MSTWYLLFLLFKQIICWDLHHLAPPNAPISRVSIWRNKAYLAVPRWTNGVKATLISAQWPEETRKVGMLFNVPVEYTVKPYPTLAAQQEGNCDALQSVTAVKDDAMGRLWVVDAGNDVCQPKIVVYDLWRNEQISSSVLRGIPGADLRAMALDVCIDRLGPCTRAYVGDPGDGGLIVYSLKERRWWRLNLELPAYRANELYRPVHKIYSSDMALARRESLLYISSNKTDQLFAVDLKTIRSDPPPPIGQDQTTNVRPLGSKLGPSSGLAMDYHGGLHYFLIRDHVALRWDTKKALEAESHAVLLQSADALPYVNDIVVDPQTQVWAVVNQTCVKIQNYLNLPRYAWF